MNTRSDTWKALGFVSRGRVVAQFDLWSTLPTLPCGNFKVKVVERDDGSFFALSNVCCITQSGDEDWVGGSADVIDDAVTALLVALAQSAAEHKPTNERLGWADPREF